MGYIGTFECCEVWPDELKELSRRHYRAVCRLRNLEAAIDRTPPDEFDGLMDQLEAAREELDAVAYEFLHKRISWAGKIDYMQPNK